MSDSYTLFGPLLRRLPPEAAHRLTIRALRTGLARTRPVADDPLLAVHLWGRDFPNPLGLAAGFDKHGEVADALLALGFGFVEIGSVTPRPQAGNPPPRLFRLPEDGAVINRLGFNSEGHDRVAARLAARARLGIVGVNLGKNRDAADAAADFAAGMRVFAPLADYLVVNLSSPNTPGLRGLQERAALGSLLDRLQEARRPGGPPLLLKIAPDLTDGELEDIARLALDRPVDGLIVGNTTIARPPGLRSRHKGETGGLSGLPLMAPSTRVLARMHLLTEGRVPLVGCGGIASGADAYMKVRAGATLLELYTALIYQGPGLVGRIKTELAALLRADRHKSLAAAVGRGAREMADG